MLSFFLSPGGEEEEEEETPAEEAEEEREEVLFSPQAVGVEEAFLSILSQGTSDL